MLNVSKFKKNLDKFFNIEESEIIKKSDKLLEKGNQLIDEIDKKYQVEPLSIEEFLNKISIAIDKKIIDTAKQKKLNPIGGEIKLFIEDRVKDVFDVSWEFYFTDNEEKVIKVDSNKKYELNYLTDNSQKKLSHEPLVFEIDPPIIN